MNQICRWAGRAMLCLVSVMLTACGSLLESTQVPDRTYLLHPYTSGETGVSTGKGLWLDVTAIPGLDTDHMLTLGTDAELSRLAGVRWPDHLPEFLGSLLRLSLQDSGRYTRVTSKRNAALDDCSLVLEAQQFYTRLDSGGNPERVSIAITGHHECDGRMTPVALEAGVAINSRRAADIVAAHQSALNRVTESLHRQLEAATDPQ